MNDFENEKNNNEENNIPEGQATDNENEDVFAGYCKDASQETVESTGVQEDTQDPEITKSQKVRKEIISWVVCIAIAIVAALLIRNYVFTMVKVDGNSMNPTLNHGERLFTRIIGYNPDRGDIIIFHPKHSPKISYVKRVIAVEGDRIKIDYEGNVHLKKKGSDKWEKLSEPYISCQTVEGIEDSMINCVENTNGDCLKISSDGSMYMLKKGSDTWEIVSGVNGKPDGMNIDRSAVIQQFGNIADSYVLVEEDHVFVMGDNRSLGGSFDSRKSGVGQVHVDSVLGKASFRWWPLSQFGGLD